MTDQQIDIYATFYAGFIIGILFLMTAIWFGWVSDWHKEVTKKRKRRHLKLVHSSPHSKLESTTYRAKLSSLK